MNWLLGLGAGILVFFIIALLITAFFLWIGVKLAGIRGASFGKAIIAALLSIIATMILSIILSLLPFIGGFLGLLLGILVSIYIIRVVFDTSWGKALVAWILYIIAIIIAMLITGFSSFLFFSSML
jgi:hypothetical protein